MSEWIMNYNDDDTIILVYHKIRRAMRAIQRVLDIVDEDDIQRKFKQFLEEHKVHSQELKNHVDYEIAESDTPEAIIQFPLSTHDLLSIAAKSEKQILVELNEHLETDLPKEIEQEFKSMRQNTLQSYDYMQALADVWS